MNTFEINGPQCRAARALLGWSMMDLQKVSGVSESAIRAFEGGRSEPSRATMKSLISAFERESVRFFSEENVGDDQTSVRRYGVMFVETASDKIDPDDIPMPEDHVPMTPDEVRDAFPPLTEEDIAAIERLSELAKKLKR